MDPTIPQGQAAVGGMDAIRQAMQRRGFNTPTPQLNQVTPTAPSAPNAVPPQAPPQTSAMPQEQMLSSGGAPMSPTGAVGMGTPESTIIIKALDNRLKMIGQQGQ